MPSFGKKSIERLKTCDPKLQELFNEVVKNYDCSVLEGHRTRERQMELFFAKPQRSKVQWPNSKHNTFPSRGIDVVPYFKDSPHIRWDDMTAFALFAGYVLGVADQMGIKIRAGIDWNGDWEFNETFVDAPHFELVD
jgi:peptidoglycan LD-endopeptidase CwlK